MAEYLTRAEKEALIADMAEEDSRLTPMEPKFMVPQHDSVNHPDHYCSGQGVECIDALKSMTFKMVGFVAFCAANAVKYIWRHPWKGRPVEDLKKARFYIDRLIEYYESEEVK